MLLGLEDLIRPDNFEMSLYRQSWITPGESLRALYSMNAPFH